MAKRDAASCLFLLFSGGAASQIRRKSALQMGRAAELIAEFKRFPKGGRWQSLALMGGSGAFDTLIACDGDSNPLQAEIGNQQLLKAGAGNHDTL